jgi:ABC-2 type transport system ATP-binding protein
MVRELSLGERMKMELVAALLHRPRVLFLDEPTIGLDVVSQKTVREFLRQYNSRQKVTILLTSHYMTDIQELCKRVIIIDKGRIFFDGRLGEIIDRFSGFKILTLTWQTGASFPAVDFGRYGELVEQSAQHIQLKVKRDQVIAVCKELLDKVPVTDIDIQEVPIEEVIRRIFAR